MKTQRFCVQNQLFETSDASRSASRSELRKSCNILGSVQKILEDYKRNRCKRNEPILVVGGGFITDLAGFASGLYHRGTPHIMLCTSVVSGKNLLNLLETPKHLEIISKKKIVMEMSYKMLTFFSKKLGNVICKSTVFLAH